MRGGYLSEFKGATSADLRGVWGFKQEGLVRLGVQRGFMEEGLEIRGNGELDR
jgi:hypothetical protein